MCKLIENNCQILKIENSWPAEFNCENETIYPPKLCKVNFKLYTTLFLFSYTSFMF